MVKQSTLSAVAQSSDLSRLFRALMLITLFVFSLVASADSDDDKR